MIDVRRVAGNQFEIYLNFSVDTREKIPLQLIENNESYSESYFTAGHVFSI